MLAFAGPGVLRLLAVNRVIGSRFHNPAILAILATCFIEQSVLPAAHRTHAHPNGILFRKDYTQEPNGRAQISMSMSMSMAVSADTDRALLRAWGYSLLLA
jgi:hypothetical protein